MAYAISSIGSMAALVTFIQDTCVANGWTLSGNILYKDTAYVEIIADGTVGVKITGGTGHAAGALTGASTQSAYFGTHSGITVTFPLSVEININTSPDEIYVVINYATNYYGLIAWGISDVPGLPGTGNWYHAVRTATQGSDQFYILEGGVSYGTNYGGHIDGTAMFCGYSGSGSTWSGGVNNTFIHDDLDGGGWHNGDGSWPSAFAYQSPLLADTPSLWNGEAVLVPYSVYFPRASNKHSLVADLGHIRLLRIDNHAPGDTITLGSDQWKIYPFFCKNTVERNGGATKQHSGTFGYAVRYTGT